MPWKECSVMEERLRFVISLVNECGALTEAGEKSCHEVVQKRGQVHQGAGLYPQTEEIAGSRHSSTRSTRLRRRSGTFSD
jgi:hypothetical protein